MSAGAGIANWITPVGASKRLNDSNKSKKSEKKTVKIRDPKNLLDAMDQLCEGLYNSKFSDSVQKKMKVLIKYIADFMEVNDKQAMLLTIMLQLSRGRYSEYIDLEDISRYLDCSVIKSLTFKEELDNLVERRILRCMYEDKEPVRWRFEKKAFNAFKSNKKYVPETVTVATEISFIKEFSELLNQFSDREFTFDQYLNEVKNLIKQVPHIPLYKPLKKIEDFNFVYTDILLRFINSYNNWNGDEYFNTNEVLNRYGHEAMIDEVAREIHTGTNCLVKENFIEYGNNNGIVDTNIFRLAKDFPEKYLPEIYSNRKDTEMKALASKMKSDGRTTSCDDIKEKKMIYNPEEEKQVAELGGLLENEHFKGIQERMEEAGMRRGFCCLFYGAPGTGKTETVYQIARATGRDILRVDVDQIKSCWVGETEQNMKAVFTRYRGMCQSIREMQKKYENKKKRKKKLTNSDEVANIMKSHKNSKVLKTGKSNVNIPILLFNEADAILGLRMEGATRAVDKMENSMQNIILQEMESLDGIMIATTNLTTNLDKAFERRFLYKIKFNKPDLKSRIELWKSMMKGISEEDAEKIAKKFDMSGGEIENVIRKYTVKKILHNVPDIDLEILMDLCKQEKIDSRTNKVGFNNNGSC